MRATHIPRRPKNKPLRGKKVGFAEKKLRLPQKMAHRVYHGWCIPTCEWLATTDPPRLTALAAAVSKLRSASPSLAWSPQDAISDGDLLALTSFCSLPSHSSHHPSKPHQIKQSLSKRAVNKRVVGKRQSILQKRWLGYLLYCKL